MKKCLEKNGITLIALMISIIILIILAGVSLNLAMGENGIIGRAISAREQHEASSEKELIELAVSAAMVDGQGTITTENLNKELKEQFGNENEVNPTSVGWNYNSNKRYRIYKNGKLEENFLPDNYQQVEYIESNGTQYIDTKVTQNSNCSIFYDVSVKFSNGGNAIGTGIVGAYTRYTQGFGISQILWQNQYRICNIINQITLAVYSSVSIDNMWENRHQFFLKKNEFYVDGILISDNKQETVSNCTTNCYLFGMSGSTLQMSSQKLYNAKLYNENDKIVRNFIPCYSATTVADINGNNCPSGTIGMYDLVENKFYTNSGSGTFLKGPDV